MFFLYIDILDRGQSGFPEIIAKHVVKLDISPECLGHKTSKKSLRSKITNADDLPEEIIEEPSADLLLKGMILQFYHTTQIRAL